MNILGIGPFGRGDQLGILVGGYFSLHQLRSITDHLVVLAEPITDEEVELGYGFRKGDVNDNAVVDAMGTNLPAAFWKLMGGEVEEALKLPIWSLVWNT